MLNKYAVITGPNSPSHNKLTNGTDDAPDLDKLSTNCSFVLTHDICSISLFFIAYFIAPMSIPKSFSVMYLFEAKASQSDLLSVTLLLLVSFALTHHKVIH